MWEFTAHSEADTARLAEALAQALPAPGCLALNGPLGAGKTRLAQALGAALDVPAGEITSPTFVLVQTYLGRREITHVDFYRLGRGSELEELGWRELLEGDLLLIEWADRFPRALPDERIELALAVLGPSSRRITLTAHGPAHSEALEQLAQTLGLQAVPSDEGPSLA